ncbi:hypothetical protein HON52_04670 [Candidatus Uhrbacteria bacterium]|jgi:hypothetical protein|nr:hypothetical protein [Candidatus Uhrbacteria bacterium]
MEILNLNIFEVLFSLAFIPMGFGVLWLGKWHRDIGSLKKMLDDFINVPSSRSIMTDLWMGFAFAYQRRVIGAIVKTPTGDRLATKFLNLFGYFLSIAGVLLFVNTIIMLIVFMAGVNFF